MAWTATSPINGGTVTGFTSPTYTFAHDNALDSNGKREIVTALGGTQAGVDVHTLAKPFSCTWVRPRLFKNTVPLSPSGQFQGYAVNRWYLLFEKGMLVLANQPPVKGSIKVEFNIPAGADVADAANLKALYSFAAGMILHQCGPMADSAINGQI